MSSSITTPKEQGASAIDQIEKLADLKERGIITEEEFKS